ncbi:putative DNA protecting protein DprA [Magnetospirillum sp. LM-5]|uniref:DNA-processing protein DprA n=1 Tax=Magnetospirillum sp. LM-5 TaxID=2681466 RepID=UPI00137E8784|nr:DNA-processing protein DprA [Magnetospirillum sp. LM-5]CAA7616486.1 putative DNA protecting protein DprA [Magnetospirillum sp. LM-5]
MAFDRPDVVQLVPGAPSYPEAVSMVFGRKSPALWALGNIGLLGLPGIGFCGSRKASEKGMATATDCAEQAAANGFTVISGNAAGVDFFAHEAALRVGGCTVLVLPEGIDHFRIRKDLRAAWDWRRVLVLSQFPPDAAWQAYRAMERNALIVALSKAMIVIEAGATGGTLNAGLATLSAGKPLFVAVYEDMGGSAVGNAALLERGGMPLARSRTTGRANLEKVRAATQGFGVGIVPRGAQPALL